MPDENPSALEEPLRRLFGHQQFRPGQAEVVSALLRRESVLAVMPTGAGKSLCYQLAAMVLPGTTLVISPLIALMKDQLDGLPNALAAQSTALNHTLDGSELDARLQRVARGEVRLVYAAPERLRQRPFLHAMSQAHVSLLVVDEAHCVSLWGHDFRPDYLFIARAWRELGEPTILALTATATPRVRDDICASFGRMRLISTGVDRPNLYFEAARFSYDREKREPLIALCQGTQGAGIVYANLRERCEQLAQMLCRAGVQAIPYHAGIEDRAGTQDKFMTGKARIVVATVAFGMGIDKADVRFIVHYNPPRTLENYYQEAGRAGRDGLAARCVLFYAPGDKSNLTAWAHKDSPHVDLLRAVYAAIQQRLGTGGVGPIAFADLERDVDADETQLRVAVHMLESAGLLWRGFDLPRAATLTLLRRPDAREPELERLVQAGRLGLRQSIARDTIALCQAAGLDPRTAEVQLLRWQDAGWLGYRGSGRDMLLALPATPVDLGQKVEGLLAAYRAGQDGRIGEIMAYAGTKGCRHAYISDYFGGRPIEGCRACDNCAGRTCPTPRTQPAARVAPRSAPKGSPESLVLQAVTELPFPVGVTSLSRALKGLPTGPLQANRFRLFGAMSDRTAKSIGELIYHLIEQGLLTQFDKGDYRLLAITAEGRAWLAAQR